MGALAELIKLGIKTAAKQADKAVPKAVSKVDDISVFPKPQKMFPEDARPAGGEYLNPATQDILTGKNFSKGNISITPEGRPSFKVSPSEKEIVGSPDIKGATQIKTNLFKKKAGWKWNKAPKGYEDAPTLVSVENKGKHYYTLDAQFPEGVNLSRYAKSKTEPRLRPTIKGFVELGKPIGKISVRGKEHPVYDKKINREEGGQVLPVIKREAGGGADYEGAAEAYAAMAEENTPTSGFMDDTDAGLYSDAYGQPGKYVSPEDANKDLTGTDMRFNPLQSPEMKAMTSNPYYFNPNAPKDKEEADRQAKDVQLFENFKHYGVADPWAHMTLAERKNEAILEMLEKKNILEEEYGLTIRPDGEIVRMAADEVAPMFKGGQVLEGLDGEYMRKRNSKEKLEGMIGIQPRQYGGGLDDVYMNRRRSSAFADPNATSAFASPMSMGGLPTIYREQGGPLPITSVYGQGIPRIIYRENGGSFMDDADAQAYADAYGGGYDMSDQEMEQEDRDAGSASITQDVPYTTVDETGTPSQKASIAADRKNAQVFANIGREIGDSRLTNYNRGNLDLLSQGAYNVLVGTGITDAQIANLTAQQLSNFQAAYDGKSFGGDLGANDFSKGYRYGGPRGTIQDILEKGLEDEVDISDLVEQAEYRKKYEEEFEKSQLSGFELAKAGLKGFASDVADMFSIRSNLRDDPYIIDQITQRAEEAGLNPQPVNSFMAGVMDYGIPLLAGLPGTIAKGLSNLTGAGRTIMTVTKDGQKYNLSDTGKFSLNEDLPEYDEGNEATPVRPPKPVQKAVASTTEEKPLTGIEALLAKRKKPVSREASNKYNRALLDSLGYGNVNIG